MKRWQDCGEVLDSDDEEGSLGAESQSHGRPAKKARIEGGGTEITKRGPGTHEEEDDLDGWVQPKPAVTYGRKAISTVTIVTDLANVQPKPFDAPPNTDGNDVVERTALSQQRQPDANHFTATPDHVSSGSEELPNFENLAGSNADQTEQGLGNKEFSIPSSPLSERAISPSPPPLSDIFRFSTPQPALVRRTEAIRSPVLNEARTADGPSDVDVFAGLRRRNLRIRNEKQIHPYMFDKAQYQQQCRDRGMRPVRVLEAEQQAAGSQDSSAGDHRSESSQIRFENGSSSPARGGPLGKDGPRDDVGHEMAINPRPTDNVYDSGDDLPEFPAILKRSVPDGVQLGSKRRRLFNTTGQSPGTIGVGAHHCSQDDVRVPPSPPPTSSDQNDRLQFEPPLPKFRMPRGLTPSIPLPTPQVSSDIRHIHDGGEAETSEEDVPSKRFRPSTVSRSRPQVVAVSISSESSESEEEPALDERRLYQERKRIKGVLPASWLKIDFRAQQRPQSPPKARARRAESSSPERISPQKGVAQRIMTKRSASSNRPATIDISDDDDDDDSESASNYRSLKLSPRRIKQTRLDFQPSQKRTERHEFVDVDEMEVDWIDPMFAGGSTKSASRTAKKRQPKIADVLRGDPRQTTDISEDRRAMRFVTGAAMAQHKPRETRRKHRKQSSTVPRLSILDAPAVSPGSHAKQPVFVRVAMRQARRRTDNARQSPSHKIIRLSTKEDTESATAVLREWREGTIRPRSIEHGLNHDRSLSTSTLLPQERRDTETQLRTPLAEVSANRRLGNPFELQKTSNQPKLKRVTTAHRPRLQQTRLNHEIIVQEDTPPTQDKPTIALVQNPKHRQPRAQPRLPLYRGAQLESLETEFDQNHRAAAFDRRMQLLTQGVARRGRNQASVQLENFLYGSGTLPTPPTVDVNQPKNLEIPAPKEALPHRIRKRPAQRLDAEAREYRQPSEPLPDLIDVDQLPDEQPAQPISTLQGLGPFGTRYATDFDILPLAVGTYFHESSFIGSGDFAAALSFAGRDLDKVTGRISIHVDGEVLEWGAWTEEVASGLARIPRAISDALGNLVGDAADSETATASLVLSNVDYLLRSTTRYLSRCLGFLDPVDRKSCIERIRSFVEDLFELLDENSTARINDEIAVRCLQYGLVIAKQVLELSNHPSMNNDVKIDCRKLVDRAALRLVADVLPCGLPQLRSFYDDNRHASKREAGIRDDNAAVTSVVILHHVLSEPAVHPSPFWAIIYQHLNVNDSALWLVSQFDRAWYEILTILPVLEIDANGIGQIGTRLHGAQEDWSLVRRLVERLFSFYGVTSASHGSTINDYVRATLIRCHRLMTRWGWWRGEALLGTIFDFFARRGLAQLHKEESRGSPRFLEGLKDAPSLDVQVEDRSFHIFLKLLASGLIGMRQHGVYTEKKIGGIAWRFIPNHGRTYRKDAEVKQHYLDALRNHHDLLCTLYYATPTKHRLRVGLLRNLVDHSVSHREACRLSVRAWANLASFQISTDEGEENLQPFIEWYREMFSATMTQFRLAKYEVEQEVESARAQGQMQVPQHIIDDTIARNQRQIAATLVDLLAALQRALKAASSSPRRQCLLNGTVFWDVFDLYDPSTRRLNSVLDEALSTVQTALGFGETHTAEAQSCNNSEDSQDYGDSAALQELASTEPAVQREGDSTTDLLHEPVRQLVSNLNGADVMPDDVLFTKAVDTWVQVAQRKVRTGEASWTHYFDGYTSAAWNQFRDTEQRRKITPYFLARIVDLCAPDLREISILSSWLESLVEREAMLKSQHVLTSKLLNKYPDETLLWNLPFVRPASGVFSISLQELRQQRLQLISSVLSNMRDQLDTIFQSHPTALEGVRRDYATMLRRMMGVMKTRYQDFDSADNSRVANASAQGAYVEFVQQVVSLLQQYTTGICQVDNFFTDSTAFPLPVSDPTYVVGRLRSYIPKLAEGRKRMELAATVKSVSERAAADCQQGYLVEQLVAAMSGVAEEGKFNAPTLRHVLMTTILPVYVENALSVPCLWILAKPILDACGRCVDELLYQTMFQEERSVLAATEIVMTFFSGMAKTIAIALDRPGLVALPHVQTTLTSIFEAARRCLTVAHHLYRSQKPLEDLRRTMMLFNEHAEAVEARLSGTGDFDIPRPANDSSVPRCHWPDTLEFARKQLGDRFGQEWYAEDGRYYIRRRNNPVEVAAPLDDDAVERARLLASISSFRESYTAIFYSHGRGRIKMWQDTFGALIV